MATRYYTTLELTEERADHLAFIAESFKAYIYGCMEVEKHGNYKWLVSDDGFADLEWDVENSTVVSNFLCDMFDEALEDMAEV
jgi:hypothetical protein